MKFIKAIGNFLGKLKKYAINHKIISVIVLLVLVGGGYWLYTIVFPKVVVAQYELAKIENGSIVSSVSGTGQVSASNQVDLSAKVSGKVIYINGASGQEVKEGDLIAQIDSGTTGYELQNAQLSYQNSITTNQDDLKKAQDSLLKARESLDSSYVDGLATLTSVSSKMLDSVEKMKELYENGGYFDGTKNRIFSENIRGQIKISYSNYINVRNSLNLFIADSNSLSSATSKEDIANFIDKSYLISLQISQTTKLTQDTVINARDKESDYITDADAAYSDAVSNALEANSIVSSISSAKKNITLNISALSDAQITLKNLEAGQNSLDVRSKLLALQQKEDSYSDYFIRAPFDGVIASIDVQKGNEVSSNNSIATVITKKKIAEISLNEIDAAKVKVGQKATITFDAIEDLSLAGEVAEVNLVGTVSQGVVSYTIKIGFDSEDDRIKPGMTATADIVINSAENVLVVPTSAIKTRGSKNFIQIVKENVDPKNFKNVTLISKPQSVEVTTGITNDDSSEITSGLSEGDVYIVKTVTTSTTATKTTTTTPSLFGAAGAKTGSGTTRAGNFDGPNGR
jgi:HlyD family secretion protein